ncbi:MAG TPA: hypothetical protein VLR94_07490 [Acidobacteriota bacterium]|nr:hypothetical protein [Acidobacteriota bacterium]
MKEKGKLQHQIDAHAQACESCAGTADWVHQILSAMAARDLVDAPEYVLHRAISMFPKKKRILPRLVQAVLRFDSWAEPMAAGVRSQDPAPRQLMYQTQDLSIFLMFLPSPQRGAVVLGQIVPIHRDSETSGYRVELKERDRILSHERTNRAGEFYLKSRSRKPFTATKGVPKRNIDLLVYKEQDSIVLRDITGIHN